MGEDAEEPLLEPLPPDEKGDGATAPESEAAAATG